jgi:(4S)-4-hydroxy-5-phosphonooxypentane-2,3-dione isomerase
MYVVTVLFTLKPEYAAEFLQAVTHNAKTSLAEEPGCSQFDVCIPAAASNQVFLYEIYDSKAAFDVHLASSHFHAFDVQSAPWVVTKAVNVMERVPPKL